MAGNLKRNSVDLFKAHIKNYVGNANFVLVANSCAFDTDGTPLYLHLQKTFFGQFKALLALQHGFLFDAQDNMRYSESFFWKELNLRVFNLYQRNLLALEEALKGVDLIIIDIVDAGCRVYTYLNHLVLLLKKLNGSNIRILILDRPNPLNGISYEGNLLEKGYFSFVGQLPVPMRHGLTVAEYLNFARIFWKLDLNLNYILDPSWRREDGYLPETFFPSPNLGSWQAALLYPGAVLLEGTNISEGRGTIKPFEIFGAPYINSFELLAELKKNTESFSGFYLTPLFFKPEFSKYQNRVCQGVKINLKEKSFCHSYLLFYEIIRAVKNLYPQDFMFTSPPYEFETKRLPIDMIAGGSAFRQALNLNLNSRQFYQTFHHELQLYSENIKNYWLYS